MLKTHYRTKEPFIVNLRPPPIALSPIDTKHKVTKQTKMVSSHFHDEIPHPFGSIPPKFTVGRQEQRVKQFCLWVVFFTLLC